MRHKIFVILLLVGSLCSCVKTDQNFGVSTYHPDFLWIKADTTFAEKTLILNFSDDAVSCKSYAKLIFTNLKYENFDTSIAQIMVNGSMVNDGFEVRAIDLNKTYVINLRIRFLPTAKAGKQYGYLRVVNHDLDRVNESITTNNDEIDVFKWEIDFQKKMNPLKRALYVILSVVLIMMLLWLVFLRRVFYPVFPRFIKMVKFGESYAQNIAFTGARELVFSNRAIKQSFFDRIFRGKVIVVNNSLISDEFRIKPKGKNQALVLDSTLSYRVNPNPIPKNGTAEIVNNKTKIIIKLN